MLNSQARSTLKRPWNGVHKEPNTLSLQTLWQHAWVGRSAKCHVGEKIDPRRGDAAARMSGLQLPPLPANRSDLQFQPPITT